MPPMLFPETPFLILADAAADARATGEFVGRCLGGLLFIVPSLWGVQASLKSYRNPEVNRLCSLAMLIFSAGVLGAFSAILGKEFGLSTAFATGLSGLVALVTMPTAMLVGVAGLISRHRSEPRRRGAKIGGWAVALSGGLFSLILFAGWQASQAARAEITVAGSSSKDRESSAGREQLFEDLNLAFRSPSTPWVEIPPKTANPDATLLVRRTRPEVYFMVIGEKSEQEISPELLASISAANLKSLDADALISEHQPSRLAGVEGKTFDSEVTVGFNKLAYRHGVITHNGFAYQAIAWGRHRDKGTVHRSFQELTDRLSLIDPEASCLAASLKAAAKPHTSVELGYRVTPQAGWTEFAGLHEQIDTADYGALYANEQCAMIVVATPLGGEPVSLDHLAQAMLGQHGVSVSDNDLRELRRTDPGPGEGPAQVVYEWTPTKPDAESDEYEYRFVVRREQDIGYLISAWTALPEGVADTALSQGIGAFEVTGPPALLVNLISEERCKRLAIAANELGLWEYKAGETRRALSRFAIAAEMYSGDEAIIDNLAGVSEEIEGVTRALERVAPYATEPEAPRWAHLIHARLLSAAEQYGEALEHYTTASDRRPLDDDNLLAMCNCAVAEEQYGASLAALDLALAARKTPTLLRWRGVMASRAGRHDDAIARLSELHTSRPGDVEVLVSLAEAYETADRAAEGVRLCESFLRDHEGSRADLLPLLGRLQAQTDDYLTAKETLQLALDINPSDSETIQLLTYVSAQLGRGDNRLIRRPIDAVPLPEALLAIHQAQPPESELQELGEETGLIYLSQQTGYSHEPGQPRRVTERRRIYVANRDGVEQVSTLTVGFDPLNERAFVNRLAVFDGDRLVAEGQLEDYYVQDEADSYDSYNQELIVPVPGLKPGVVVELVVTRETLSPREYFGYEQNYLTAFHPVIANTLYVTGDLSNLAHQAFRSEPLTLGPDTLGWIARRPTRVTLESFQPDYDTYLPNVRLADRGSDWATLGAEYLEDLAPTLSRDPDVDTLADELCRDAQGTSERVYRLGRHVQNSLTYHAQEFGVRGVIPNRVDRIRHAASGDCKDHALLLHHLLRAQGIDSRLALVSTSKSVSETLPSLDQFDHMVALVAEDNQPDVWRVVDPTNKTLSPLLPVSPGVAGRRVLLLDSKDSRLVTIGAIDAGSAKATCRRRITLEPSDGAATLLVTERVTLGPIAAASIRAALSKSSQRDQRETLWKFLGNGWSGKLTRLDLKGLDELDQPLQIDCQYRLEEAWNAVNDDDSQYNGRIPSAWASLFFETSPTQRRSSPMQITTPIDFQSVNEIHAPVGYQVVPVKKTVRQAEAEGLAWRVERRMSSGQRSVVINSQFRRFSGRWPAAAYDSYATQSAKAVRRCSGPITIRLAN